MSAPGAARQTPRNRRSPKSSRPSASGRPVNLPERVKWVLRHPASEAHRGSRPDTTRSDGMTPCRPPSRGGAGPARDAAGRRATATRVDASPGGCPGRRRHERAPGHQQPLLAANVPVAVTPSPSRGRGTEPRTRSRAPRLLRGPRSIPAAPVTWEESPAPRVAFRQRPRNPSSARATRAAPFAGRRLHAVPVLPPGDAALHPPGSFGLAGSERLPPPRLRAPQPHPTLPRSK